MVGMQDVAGLIVWAIAVLERDREWPLPLARGDSATVDEAWTELRGALVAALELRQAREEYRLTLQGNEAVLLPTVTPAGDVDVAETMIAVIGLQEAMA